MVGGVECNVALITLSDGSHYSRDNFVCRIEITRSKQNYFTQYKQNIIAYNCRVVCTSGLYLK